MKDQIIETALYMFLNNGVLQTSLIDIAKSLNLTKGAIYHYFRSKDELLFASFDLIVMGMESYITPLEDHNISLKDTFGILYEIMVSQNTEEVTGQYEFLLYCSRTYPELKSKLIEATHKFNGVIKGKILEDIKKGKVRQDLDLDHVLLKISLIFEGTMYLNQVYSPIGMSYHVPKLFDEILNEIYGVN
ncbi:MAG: TetR/AcrR family transcriptional regulator [Clostridia bacterium]|nr:TetR/AcrR family transcriptional regulator [Clostridia bacterium]